MRRTRTLVVATAAVVATIGGITIASASADPAVEATSTRIAATKSDQATAAAAPVAGSVAATRSGEQAATPTKIVWTRRNTWVTYGSTATLEGQVQNSSGALPGAPVRLYARNSSSKPWTHIDSATTSTSTGLFRFYRKPPRNYYFRVSFAGNANYEASHGYAEVGVRRKLSPSYMARLSNGNFKYYGSVKPSYRYQVVKLQYKQCGSCGWRYVKYTRANENSTWRFIVTGPSQSGRTYYYRAYSPSSDSYLAGYADEWRIRT